MLFDGLQRNMQPLGDLPVLHPLKTAEDENLAAALRKRIRDTLDLALQLLIKIRVFGLVIGKTEIIETFFPPPSVGTYSGDLTVGILPDDTFVLQKIQTAMPHHGKEQHRRLVLLQFGIVVPQSHETILHQVLRFDGIAHEPQRIGDQPRLIIDIQPLEIIPYGPVVHS